MFVNKRIFYYYHRMSLHESNSCRYDNIYFLQNNLRDKSEDLKRRPINTEIRIAILEPGHLTFSPAPIILDHSHGETVAAKRWYSHEMSATR